MNEKLESVLFQVASDTLEQLAFLFSSPEYINCCPDYEQVVVASVSFSGHFSGKVSLMIAYDILDELTENMLGIDKSEELSLEQKHDALKESINIVCGNLLPFIGGKKALFSIDSPVIIQEKEDKRKALKNDQHQGYFASARLSIDDKPCYFYLLIDDKDAELEI